MYVELRRNNRRKRQMFCSRYLRKMKNVRHLRTIWYIKDDEINIA